jgi:hypothetical protein
MHIEFDKTTGKITSILVRSGNFKGTLPGDLLHTFALGKYTASADSTGNVTITEVAGWVAPARPPMTAA